MRTASPYHQLFREVLAETGMLGVDPRHAEAWARLEWGTLDHLSRAEFRRFVLEMADVLLGGQRECESLARSYAMREEDMLRGAGAADRRS